MNARMYIQKQRNQINIWTNIYIYMKNTYKYKLYIKILWTTFVFVFHFPIPFHQCSITLICVRMDLFVSFSLSIANAKKLDHWLEPLRWIFHLDWVLYFTFHLWGFHETFSQCQILQLHKLPSIYVLLTPFSSCQIL